MTGRQSMYRAFATQKPQTKKEISEMPEFHAAYRYLASNKKAALGISDAIAWSIYAKQTARHWNWYGRQQGQKITTINQRLADRRLADYRQHMVQFMRICANGTFRLEFGDTWMYNTSHYTNWDLYHGRYKGWKADITDITVTIPHGSSINRDCMLRQCDNIPNVMCKPIQKIGTITVYAATWYVQHRGFEAEFVSGYIAEMGNIYYHATTTAHDAIEGLRHKQRRIGTRQRLTLNTYMSATKYARLTGACMAGINAWCANHGIDPSSKMRVRDLLPLLSDDDYGSAKIRSLIPR